MSQYGFRYLIPVTGRWAVRDPIGELGGSSVLTCSRNSPINIFDALGLSPQFPSQNSGCFEGERGHSWYFPNNRELPPSQFVDGTPDFSGVARYVVRLPCQHEGGNREPDVTAALTELKRLQVPFGAIANYQWHHFMREGILEMQYVPRSVNNGIHHFGPVSQDGRAIMAVSKSLRQNGGYGPKPEMKIPVVVSVGNAAVLGQYFLGIAMQAKATSLGEKLNNQLEQVKRDCMGKATQQPGCCVVFIKRTMSEPSYTTGGWFGIPEETHPPSGYLTDIDISTNYFSCEKCQDVGSFLNAVDRRFEILDEQRMDMPGLPISPSLTP